MHDTMFMGLDVHEATISVAVASAAREGEIRYWDSIVNRADHVRKLVEKLQAKAGQLHFCYEIGPCGYGLHRQLVEFGHAWDVVAPSLITVRSGDRVRTDRRDAAMLAKLHQAGELTVVWVPDTAHKAMRDLVRARDGSRGRRQGAAAPPGLPASPWSDLSWKERLDRCLIGAGRRRSGSTTPPSRSFSKTTCTP